MSDSVLDSAVYGLFSTQVLHLADKYGVLDALSAEQPRSAAAVAAHAGVDAETVDRLLTVLAAVGVLNREAGGYRMIAAYAPYLRSGHPQHLGTFLTYLVESTAEKIGKLDEYLLKGKAAVDAEAPAPFEAIYRDEASTGQFLTAMWQLTFGVSEELVRLADLSGTRHLVDVGGASGAFAVQALSANPDLVVTVFDLPEVEPHLLRTRDRHGLEDRLRFAPGDFFRDPLPEGDCLHFGYILSDWDDDTCVALLRKAYEACHAGGRVLISDRLFDDAHVGPLSTAVMNLSMHIETEVATALVTSSVDCSPRPASRRATSAAPARTST
ncbi:methyltransferase [Micromonospora sp. M12]